MFEKNKNPSIPIHLSSEALRKIKSLGQKYKMTTNEVVASLLDFVLSLEYPELTQEDNELPEKENDNP